MYFNWFDSLEIRDDFIKLDGKFEIENGDRISGRSSGVSAEITSIINTKQNLILIFQIDKNMDG